MPYRKYEWGRDWWTDLLMYVAIPLLCLALLIVLILLVLSPDAAIAHDLDCKGNPIPAHIKLGCCGVGDAQQLKDDEWRGDDESGYQVFLNGAWVPVVNIHDGPLKALPSDDGCVWVWYRRQGPDGYWNDGSHTINGSYNFYCLQLPMTM